MDKMPNGHLGTEVKVETDLEIITMTIQEGEGGIDIMTGPFSLMEEMNLDAGPTPG